MFKVRDLMINVLPEAGPGEIRFCRGVTLPDCALNSCVDFSYVGCAVTICAHITRCLQVTVLEACPADGGVSDCNVCVTKGGAKTEYVCPGGANTGSKLIGAQLEDLAILKEQLKRSLANVEAQELALAERLRPQTLEEVQQLEVKLTAGLEELRMRKAELEPRPPKAKG
jgi:hypothetical protein